MIDRRLAVMLLMTAAIFAGGPIAAQEAPRTAAMGDFFGIRTVDVTIAGQTHPFLFDTGGGLTAISPALAEAIGCEPWAQIVGFRMTGEKVAMPRCDDVAIRIGDQALTVPNAGVFDLTPLLPPGSAIAGLVGLDVLATQPFTLEIAERRLTFETPESLAERTEGATELPIRIGRQAGGLTLDVLVPVTTPRGTLWMLLDSGSDAPLQVSPPSAQALGLDPDESGQALTLRLAGANGEIQEESTVRVRDIILDGNIGAPIIRRWTLTLDLAGGKAWIRQRD